MYTSPRRTFGLLSFALAAGFVAAPLLAQTTKPNPLRSTASSAKSPARRASIPASQKEDSASETTAVALASHIQPVPRPSSESRAQVPAPGESYVDTTIVGGELAEAIDGEVIYDGVVKGGLVQKGGIAQKGDCCGGKGCVECFAIPCPQFCFDNLEVRGGVQGFTGPVNRGQTGSFGFHEGVNWGAPVPCFGGVLSMQVGANFTQSNLSGAEFTDERRHQTFLTGGLFRRVDWGLQGGVAFDYLSDDWYASYDVTQLRGEASWVFPCTHELGFWFTASLSEDTTLSQFSGTTPSATETFEATDLYAFFYRRRLDGIDGGNARLYAGFTGESDGLIGADMQLPIACDLAVEAGFAYLIPEEGRGTTGRGHEHESWNIAIGVVWYPGSRTAYGADYSSPLFNVADNGSFMVGRR